MSEEDESERRLVEEGEGQPGVDNENDSGGGSDGGSQGGGFAKRNDKRTKRMERAIVRLSAEIAALREQIATGREWRARREKSTAARVGWWLRIIAKHFAIDLVILFVLLLWMRRRKDRRLEDHVRGAFRVAREYIRMVLPSR
jgi:hypothetical protein